MSLHTDHAPAPRPTPTPTTSAPTRGARTWRVAGAALLLLLVTACGGGGDAQDGADGASTAGDATSGEETAEVANADLEAAEEVAADWQRHATDFRERIGTRIAYTCPEGGPVATVWGSSPYTDDSSVCSAAVHAGLITVEGGGRVVIEMTAGETSYPGGEANGVTAQDWPEWPGSFLFPGDVSRR